MNEKLNTDEQLTLQRLRTFILWLSGMIFLGALAELILSRHFESPGQLVAFVLTGIGLLAIAAFWRQPDARTARILQIAMAVVALGSAVGVGFRFSGTSEEHDRDVDALVARGNNAVAEPVVKVGLIERCAREP